MNHERKRILLVEDSEDNRFSLSKLLQLEGYAVLEAIDGAQAIEVATREKPDLILMDLSLPVMDGLTATRTIRKAEGLELTPIIALSGHDADTLGDEVKASGITDYANKPVDFDRLIGMLSRYLMD
jgi:two-component system, cell cycle response regulator DivK